MATLGVNNNDISEVSSLPIITNDFESDEEVIDNSNSRISTAKCR
jgi:hypothetical protein